MEDIAFPIGLASSPRTDLAQVHVLAAIFDQLIVLTHEVRALGQIIERAK